MIRKMPSKDPDSVVVRFELPSAIWADSVFLVADFADWDETATPMTRSRTDGTWSVTLQLKRGKEHQFRYLVNGHEWHNDWRADRYVANPFGGTNSVLCT